MPLPRPNCSGSRRGLFLYPPASLEGHCAEWYALGHRVARALRTDGSAVNRAGLAAEDGTSRLPMEGRDAQDLYPGIDRDGGGGRLVLLSELQDQRAGKLPAYRAHRRRQQPQQHDRLAATGPPSGRDDPRGIVQHPGVRHDQAEQAGGDGRTGPGGAAIRRGGHPGSPLQGPGRPAAVRRADQRRRGGATTT